ncbi:tRNA (guanine37-N1)-methyltransferase [Pancytospora epiphaga]|nr:tRNA (guanine37-N1)-methyltransferase [Pancytospora epiphaga]
MEYSAEIVERITVQAIYLNHTKLGSTLCHVKPMLANIPKIPNVVYKKKHYKAFTIVDSSESTEDVYILLRGNVSELSHLDNLIELNIELGLNYFTHTEILSRLLPKGLGLSAFETIGTIVHLNLTDEQLAYKAVIGAVLHYKTGLTIINKIGKIDNRFRNYNFEVLAGQPILETIHCENGVKIFLNLEKVYWCSRLQSERNRITDMIQPGDSICDPFCGAGPQVLPILQKNGTVYANDLNPDAISCLKRSLIINNFQCEHICNMDAGEFITSLSGKQIDHFVFNLPEHSLEYIGFLRGFKSFVLHCFFFCRKDEQVTDLVFRKTGYLLKESWLRRVRMVSPTKAVYKLEVSSDDLYDFNNV